MKERKRKEIKLARERIKNSQEGAEKEREKRRERNVDPNQSL